MRERDSHKMGRWYPQIQGPSQVKNSQGERRQRGQDTQIVKCLAYIYIILLLGPLHTYRKSRWFNRCVQLQV